MKIDFRISVENNDQNSFIDSSYDVYFHKMTKVYFGFSLKTFIQDKIELI
jgi:hypothetical protein